MGNKLYSMKREEEEEELKQKAEEKEKQDHFLNQRNIYLEFLTEELNQLKDEVIKYKITHKTTLIKDKELLHRIQDNFLKRECLKPYDDKMLFLSECLSG